MDDELEIGVVSHALLAVGVANRVASRRLVLVGMEDTQSDQESDVGQVDGRTSQSLNPMLSLTKNRERGAVGG